MKSRPSEFVESYEKTACGFYSSLKTLTHSENILTYSILNFTHLNHKALKLETKKHRGFSYFKSLLKPHFPIINL